MILSVDPGGTTGIAGLTRAGAFKTGQIAGGSEGFFDWWIEQPVGQRITEEVDAIVVENFVPRPGAKSMQLDALHIIGMLRYWCRVHNIPLVIQTPAQAKSFATNEKLKAVGWYTVGEDHGRDAARHMLVYLMAGGGVPSTSFYHPTYVQVANALAAL